MNITKKINYFTFSKYVTSKISGPILTLGPPSKKMFISGFWGLDKSSLENKS